MKKIISVFILISIIFTSCKKEIEVEGNWYTIEIRTTNNLDCRVPEITFLTGADEVKQLLGSSINIYVATGLPKVNYQPGTQLMVKIRKPDSGDFLLCTTLGPSYRQVVTTDVK
jgi:hypothetical protein